jgi:SAM-dependent methyltransferase
LSKRNRSFRAAHPDFALPPPYLVYESYALDYELYYHDGLDAARWLIGHFRRFVPPETAAILDWGCGPGRVIRHFPSLLPEARCFGSDYNASTIAWCAKNIPGVSFSRNGLAPPLAYPAGKFRIAYGISVLTHLSSGLQPAWIAELKRVLEKGGICFLTTHGAFFRDRLLKGERERFDAGDFVERGNVKDGHRTFTTFHPPAYMRGLLHAAGFEVLEHREGGPGPDEQRQDIWIARSVG